MRRRLILAAALTLAASAATAQPVTVALKTGAGADAGKVTLTEAPKGVLMKVMGSFLGNAVRPMRNDPAPGHGGVPGSHRSGGPPWTSVEGNGEAVDFGWRVAGCGDVARAHSP